MAGVFSTADFSSLPLALILTTGSVSSEEASLGILEVSLLDKMVTGIGVSAINSGDIVGAEEDDGSAVGLAEELLTGLADMSSVGTGNFFQGDRWWKL